jgi:hypothetical protein
VTHIQQSLVVSIDSGTVLMGPTIFDQAYTWYTAYNRDAQSKKARLQLWQES